ncbi:MAG: TM2 domain-containing protein [Bacteroidota bacterium]
MIKKIQNLGLLALTCLMMMSVSSTSNIPLADVEMEQSATLLAFKNLRDGLAAKAETAPLTPREAKTYKKLDKKIQKWEKRDARRAAKGKKPAGDESWTSALLLVIFLGALGIHRFYLGYTWQGVVQLLTLGGLGIWALIDLIRIITKDLKPKDGDYID